MNARALLTAGCGAALAATAIGVTSGARHVAANRYLDQGLDALALAAVTERVGRWLAACALAALLLLYVGRWLRSVQPGSLASASTGRLLRLFLGVALPFVAMDLYLYSLFLPGRTNPDLFGAHLGIQLAILALALVYVALSARRSRRRFAALLAPGGASADGRAGGGEAAALRRLFFRAASPFLAFDVFVLLLYHVRFSYFVSPLQLMPHTAVVTKLAFDALALGLVAAATRPGVATRLAGLRVPLEVAGAVALLASAGFFAAALRERPAEQRGAGAPAAPNLLLVVVDALRADGLGTWGAPGDPSPVLDALGARGVVFETARSNAASTKLAIPSLLTSKLPNEHGVVRESSVLPDAALTLAELLANQGYDARFYNGANIYLHQRFNVTQGFDRLFFQYPASGARIADVFLSELPEMGRPFFAYLHFMDVHTPYNENPYSLAAWNRDPRLRPGGAPLSDPNRLSLEGEERDALRGIYAAQIRWTDEQIGRVLEGLRGAGLLGSTLIVVTADHGEELWEHGRFGHAHAVYEELLHIPLIFAFEGRLSPRRVQEPVQIVDVMPTILDLLGVDASRFRFSGRSLVSGETLPPARPVFAMTSLGEKAVVALVEGNAKLISVPAPLDGFAPETIVPAELYDLAADPKEQHNLLGWRPELSRRLVARATEYARLGSELRAESTVIDAKLRERLRELGYVEAEAP